MPLDFVCPQAAFNFLLIEVDYTVFQLRGTPDEVGTVVAVTLNMPPLHPRTLSGVTM